MWTPLLTGVKDRTQQGLRKGGGGAQRCQNLGKTVFSALRILKSVCKLVAKNTGTAKVLSILLVVFFALLRSHISVMILVLQDRRIKRTSRNAEAKVSTESSGCLVSTCLGCVHLKLRGDKGWMIYDLYTVKAAALGLEATRIPSYLGNTLLSC